jgi:hypothetical protein
MTRLLAFFVALVAFCAPVSAACTGTGSCVLLDNGTVGPVPPSSGPTTVTGLVSGYHPSSAPSSIQTTGYATDGDLGAALYVNVGSPASYCGFSLTLAGGSTAYYALTGDIIRPEMCGPTNHTATDSTNATANTSAIQAAVNYFTSQNSGISSGKVLLSQFAINSTLTVSGGVMLEGTGWGSTLATGTPQSVLTWVGSAGVDMIKITDYWGATIKKIRLVGSTVNPPLSAIDFSTSGTPGTVIYNVVEDVWIGSIYGYDAGSQFQAALTGTSGTGSSATFTFSGSTVLPVGSLMTVLGAIPLGYNGQCTVTASSAGSVTCANTTTGAMVQSGTLSGSGQFNHGISFSGTINGDSNYFKNVTIVGINGDGIHDANPNASNLYIERFNVQTAKSCINTTASMEIHTAFCSNTFDYNFKLGTSAKVDAYDVFSEKGSGLLQLTGSGTAFMMRNSIFQIQNGDVRADGVIVDVNGQQQWDIDLENSGVQYNNGTDPATITLNLTNYPSVNQGRFRCVGCIYLWPSNFNFGSMVWTNDQRNIEYSPKNIPGTVVAPHQTILGNWNTANGASDGAWQTWRNDFAGKFNHFGGPLYVRQLSAPVNVSATASLGSGATTYGYRVSALTYDGETLASTEATIANASSLSAGVATNKISWNAELGAYAYKIYGRSAGSELLLATVTWDSLFGAVGVRATSPLSWTDDGSLTPSGALPTRNTTGNTQVDGALKASRLNPTDKGQCTMSSGACSAQGLASTYTSAPNCQATWTGTGTLAGQIKITSSTTTVTPTSSTGSDTAQVNWVCFGG